MAGSVSGLITFGTQSGPIAAGNLDTNFSALQTAVNSLNTYSNYAVDVGSANTMVVTISSPQALTLAAGLQLYVKVAQTNTGATTLNVNGLGAASVLTPGLLTLPADEILTGQVICVIYNGTAWQLTGSNGALTINTAAYADTFLGDGSTTVFTLSATPGSINSLDVSVAGSTLVPGTDYTWSGTTLTMTVAPATGSTLLCKYLVYSGAPATVTAGSVVDASLAAGSNVAYAATVGATYVRTAAEISASVTPTNYGYPPGDVRRYGADPTGTNDSTTAIQYAINSNSYVYIPSGTFSVSNITLTTNSYLYGNGYSSILKQRTSGTYAMVSADSGSSSVSSNLTGIVVRDLQLLGTVVADGFSQYIYLLGLNGVTDAVVGRVFFNGFRGDGFYLGSSYSAGVERHNQKVTVRSCVFDGINNQNRNCISVLDCDELLIEDCEFRNSTKSTMPGAIDIEPGANSFSIIKNIQIRKCRFYNIGGDVACISLYIPSAVTAAPTNISIENNDFASYVGSGGFMNFNTNRTPSSTSTKNDIRVVGNNGVSGVVPFYLFDGNRVTFRDNYFSDCTGPAYVGNTGTTNQVYDLEFVNNRLVRCGSAGAGIGMALYTVTLIHFQSNKFIDCGTGSAGSSNAVDFISGTSSYVHFDDNEWLSPTSKTLIAIQKETAHTFTANTNRFIGNNYGSLGIYFQAEESDVLETSYTCAITGATTAGTGTYTDQFALYKRIGKQVTFRVKIVCSSHTGSGLIQVGLPTLAKSATNNEETTVPMVITGASTTGGQIGLIDPSVVVSSLGAMTCYQTATGTKASITIPGGAFTLWATGIYMSA